MLTRVVEEVEWGIQDVGLFLFRMTGIAMAFELGGYADKLGNRYEGRWVVKQLLRLLNERIHSVTIEGIGEDEKGVDLIVEQLDGRKQFQQCKARNASNESWSLGNLDSRGILQKMKFQLGRNPHSEYALVSAVPGTVIGDICESARKSNGNPEDFYKYQIQEIGKVRRDAFRDFCKCLKLDEDDETGRAVAFDYLHRMRFIQWADDQNSYDELLGWAGMLVNGKPITVVAHLAEFAQDNLRQCLNASTIRSYLAKLELHPRRLGHDDRVAPAVEDLQKRFEDSIAGGLVGGELIPREETQELLKAIDEDSLIVLHGTRGYGKSGVLFELAQIIKEARWTYLPVRLDRQEPRNTARQFGEELGLPESPAICLESLLTEQRGVLIIDQLDALRWTSAHSANSLDVCKELVREVMNLCYMGKRVSVILSCRTFDLENDPEIQGWLGKQSETYQKVKKVEVKSLPDKSVAEVVKRVGGDYASLTQRQKDILSSPLHLAMWVTVIADGEVSDFQTSTQLMRKFWENRYQELAKAEVSSTEADEVLDDLVDYMEQKGTISAPASLISNRPKVYTELQSIGVIRNDDSKITFRHQNYLDFRIADRLLREIHKGQRNIKDWLGAKEKQTLFRREQLRQVLLLLCDDDRTEFLKNIKELLGDNGIRFHLKHLILEIVGQIEEPDQGLQDYLLELLGNDYWKRHILESIFWGHAQYVRLLIDRGIAAEWLGGNNEEERNRMLWLLRSVANTISDVVTETLSPYVERGGEWPQRVLRAICWNVEDDSEKMFELRLHLARTGAVSDFIHWEALAKKKPLCAIMLIEAAISTWETPVLKEHSRSRKKKRTRFEEWMGEDVKALQGVARDHPLETWDLLMPHIERLTAVKMDRYDDRLNDWLDTRRLEMMETRASINQGIVEMVCMAGRKLAEGKPDEFLLRAGQIAESISPVTEKILVRAWLGIINNKDIPEERNLKHTQVGPDRVAESSVTHFANDLRAIAKRYPDRFARLALQFPDDVHSSYLAAIFDGIKTAKPEGISEEEKASWEPAKIETIEAIIERFRPGDDHGVAQEFCWLIEQRPGENWSERAIKRLLDYAINHPDLEQGTLNVRCDISSDEATVDDLIQNAINCVRGVAGAAIGALLREHPEWLERLRPGLEHLVNDQHPAVRVAGLRAGLDVLNIDRIFAIDLFLQACQDDLRVAACRYAVYFFNCGMEKHAKRLSPVIIEMSNSDIDEIAEEGAKEVCARWLFHGLFEDELTKCKSGGIAHRKGIAKVASSLITKEKSAEQCKELLLSLFEDEEIEVRRSASHALFNRVEVLQVSGIEPFIRSYVQSAAFGDDPTGILYTFKEYKDSLLPYADVLFTMCEQFTGPLAELTQDAGNTISHDVGEMNSLLLRLYEQTKEGNAVINGKCLDMWDVLFEKGIGQVREMTKAIDV